MHFECLSKSNLAMYIYWKSLLHLCLRRQASSRLHYAFSIDMVLLLGYVPSLRGADVVLIHVIVEISITCCSPWRFTESCGWYPRPLSSSLHGGCEEIAIGGSSMQLLYWFMFTGKRRDSCIRGNLSTWGSLESGPELEFMTRPLHWPSISVVPPKFCRAVNHWSFASQEQAQKKVFYSSLNNFYVLSFTCIVEAKSKV